MIHFSQVLAARFTSIKLLFYSAATISNCNKSEGFPVYVLYSNSVHLTRNIM